MPKFRSYNWGNCRITIHSTGIRRLLSFIPYFYGSTAKLKIHVSNNSDSEVQFSYEWTLQRLHEQNLLLANKGNGSIQVKDRSHKAEQFFTRYLAIPGYYLLGIRELSEESPHTAANFTVLDRDIYVPAVILSIISIVLGASLTLLVQWLISNM